MKEYIEREALLDDIDAAMQNAGMGVIVGQTLKRYVKRQPAADVVEVVRCKDCKFGDLAYLQKFIDEDATPSIVCVQYKRIVEADEFCSYGRERG